MVAADSAIAGISAGFGIAASTFARLSNLSCSASCSFFKTFDW
jgi:hypothetical protein